MLARFVNRLEVLVPPTRELDAILAEAAAAVPKGSPRAIQYGDGARRFAIRSIIDSYEFLRNRHRSCRPCEDNWGELLSLARQYADNQATNTAIADRRPRGPRHDARRRTRQESGRSRHGRSAAAAWESQSSTISAASFAGISGPALRSETMSEMTQYDESRRFNRIATSRQREPRHLLRSGRGRPPERRRRHLAGQPSDGAQLPERHPALDECAERASPPRTGNWRQGA